MSSLYAGRGPTGQIAQGQRGGTGNIKGYQQLPNFTPEQMQLFQSLFSHLQPGSYLSRLVGGDSELFNEIEAPALQQFSGVLGGLGSRFSGQGLGGRRSSGFQNTATQAGSEFAQGLQAQRQGLQRQAIQDLFGMGESLLSQRPFDLAPKKKSFLQELLLGLSGGVGQGLGGLIG